MTRRERLMATLRGEAVDRPAVSFYELNGLDEDPTDTAPFNIYSDPSWGPLVDLTREKTDRIVMRCVPFIDAEPSPMQPFITSETRHDGHGSRFDRMIIRAGNHTLTATTRRDPDVNTVWTLEHLFKDAGDLEAWLELPEVAYSGAPDVHGVVEAEEQLADTGIVMIDTGDPLCSVASCFALGDFTVVATTEQALMHRALERAARVLLPQVEAVSKALPGRLWRICGPEYASPPYLPPYLFEQYVTRYVTPMVEAIQRHGGYARIHSHGRLKDILDHIAATGCDGLDPIEPPGQGDVELRYVREKYGKQMVLFGNLEMSDVENMPTARFAEKVERALHEGTQGEGRGFVLMPSACPYGRHLSSLTLRNYEEIIRQIEQL
ncbi:MAG TPA: hypothetical protein HPP77_08290 [Candidatus Hydrogenedentes bacterium]|nr:hypothetical protein [Candidatus Hydrogenedentota bacterium]HIJ74536.1 hypothetical protein [Candidatus Hydrogenedentota bacterium]